MADPTDLTPINLTPPFPLFFQRFGRESNVPNLFQPVGRGALRADHLGGLRHVRGRGHQLHAPDLRGRQAHAREEHHPPR